MTFKRLQAAEVPTRRPGPPRQRGTTLVEALVAFLALSFGVLALANVQATLRTSAETARHRSAAVRLAQEDLEHLRAFASIGVAPGQRSYADVVTVSRRIDEVGGGAPSFLLERTVAATSLASARSVRVQVRWTDRRGAGQSVALASIIAADDPALSGALAVAPAMAPTDAPAPVPPSPSP